MEVAGGPISDSSSLLDQQDVESSLKIYRQVFDLCDKDGNGFITKSELAHICEQASSECVVSGILDNVMQCLEPNHEGHISFDDFKSGFESFQRVHDVESTPALASSTPNKPGKGSNGTEEVYESEPVPDEAEGAWRESADRIDPQGTLTGTGVGEMWKDLYTRDPVLLENFEGFLSEVVGELKQSDHEKSSLENHIKKITEQHSREVSEMDHLLQEELQLARVNQLQNNASQTSRLSSHYSTLLAQREAVIGEMTCQETDLKQALQHKSQSESQLKQDKDYLLSMNQVLHNQLETTLRTSPPHNTGGGTGAEHPVSEVSLPTPSHLLDSEASLPSISRLMPTHPNFLDSEGSGYSLGHSQTEVRENAGMEPGLDQELAACPDSNPRLNVIHEVQEKEVRYYPPKKTPAHVDPPEVTEGVSDGNHTSHQLHSTVTPNNIPPADTRPLGGGPPHKGTGFSTKEVFPSKSVVQGSGSDVGTDSDFSLTVSEVMPRREDLCRPLPPQLASINRVFKVIFLGNSGVGKTSLIARLTEGQFSTSVVSTLGLDYSTKTLHVGEERVMFQLWDTAGQERFSNILTPVYFRRADAFVIVYDVSDSNTFKATKKWISILKAALREQPSVIMLVGNKSDKTEERCVSIEDGRRLALALQAMFSETSALSGDNVLQAHSTLAHLLLAREDADLRELKKRSAAVQQNNSNRCC